MNTSHFPDRPASTPPAVLVVTLLLFALAGAPAEAQVLARPPDLGPQSNLTDLGGGGYQVWNGEDKLGEERFHRFHSLTGDTTLVLSEVQYEIGGERPRTFQKTARLMYFTLDQRPIFYQTSETVDETTRLMSVAFRDTTIQVYNEEDGRGSGTTLVIPEGKIFLFDPSVYHHIELMVGDFARRGLQERWHHAVVPRQQEVLKLHLIRRDSERVELANGAENDAVRVDLFDDLTLFKNWVDGEGNLLLMETETQRMRVIRDPDMEREKADS